MVEYNKHSFKQTSGEKMKKINFFLKTQKQLIIFVLIISTLIFCYIQNGVAKFSEETNIYFFISIIIFVYLFLLMQKWLKQKKEE